MKFVSILNVYIWIHVDCSGQDHIVTHKRVVVTQQLENLLQILEFMVYGLITRMALTLLTVIPVTLLTHPRYFILHQLIEFFKHSFCLTDFSINFSLLTKLIEKNTSFGFTKSHMFYKVSFQTTFFVRKCTLNVTKIVFLLNILTKLIEKIM